MGNNQQTKEIKMERKVRYILLIVVFFIATVLLSGCEKKTSQAPPKQMVQDTLRASLPPFLSLDSIELEPIPTGFESVKVKFKAIVTPKEDLYRVDRKVQGTPKVTLLKVIQTAGAKASLYGSVEANRTMDLWTLESPQIEIGLEQFGAPRGAFDAQSYVTGTDKANAALKEQAANAQHQERARKTALEQRERERKAQQEREAREQKERREREEQARIAFEEQRNKEIEQQKKEDEEVRQKLILATRPGTRYRGTIAEGDERQRIRLVFTEQRDFVIYAEASEPGTPENKRIFAQVLGEELLFNQVPEGDGSVYPIVMRSVGERGNYWGGGTFGSFYRSLLSLKLRLTDTGLEGESRSYTIHLYSGDIKSQEKDERESIKRAERERIQRKRPTRRRR